MSDSIPEAMSLQPKLPPQLNPRLEAQIRFFIEADRLKSVVRRSYVTDGSRRENSAEHSWHFALGVLLLREYGGEFDLMRALQMAIIHDLVEIYAGDTFVYDDHGQSSKIERENAAATLLFGMLPPDQEAEFRGVWAEFEEGQSPAARFALVIDRLCPLLLNYTTQGKAWNEHGVVAARVRDYNLPATVASPPIQEFIAQLLDFAVQEGVLPA